MNETSHRNRPSRPWLGWFGTLLIVAGMLDLGLDAYLAPAVIRYFSETPVGKMFVVLMPFLPILLIGIGAYLVFLSKARVIRAAEAGK